MSVACYLVIIGSSNFQVEDDCFQVRKLKRDSELVFIVVANQNFLPASRMRAKT